MTKSLDFWEVFAFSRKPGLGNPAGVVWNATGLSEDEMQNIAKINNLSETAFLFPTVEKNIPYRIKFYTPAKSIPMCGHASIASAYIYWKLSGCPDKIEYRQEADVGRLNISIGKRDSEPYIYLGMDNPEMTTNYDEHREIVAEVLGIDAYEIDDTLPVMINSREYLYIPVKSIETVRKMQPNLIKMEETDKKLNIHGWYVFTKETKYKENDYHCRFFAPTYGVSEDPVTGTANAYFMEYYLKYIDPISSSGCLKVEQGFEIGKDGIIEILYNCSEGKLEEVKIGGTAIEYIEGRIVF